MELSFFERLKAFFWDKEDKVPHPFDFYIQNNKEFKTGGYTKEDSNKFCKNCGHGLKKD